MDKRLTKYWTREYKINLNIKKLGAVFYNFFKEVVDFNFLAKSKVWTPIDLNTEYSYKTFLVWANQLRKLNVIDDKIFNDFMEFLELNSPEELPKAVTNNNIDVPSREYSDIENRFIQNATNALVVFEELLKQAIDNEKYCSYIFDAAHKDCDTNYNRCYRIEQILTKYEHEWKTSKVLAEKKEEPSAIAPIKPVNKLK